MEDIELFYSGFGKEGWMSLGPDVEGKVFMW